MNLNKVFLIGNLTRDPETRALPSGQSVASFGIATNRIYKKDGKQEKQTEFHNIVAFGRLAEICSQYLTRGKMVLVEGRLVNRNWEAKDGTKKNRTEVIMENMQMGPKGDWKPADSPAGEAVAPAKAGSPKEELETIEYPSDEINPDEIKVISAAENLPIDVSDYSKTELPKRLDYRFLDLHRQRTQAIFKISSEISNAFREFFYKKNFIEVQIDTAK